MFYPTDLKKIVSKSQARPELQKVLFRGNKIVATDAFKFVEITTEEDNGLDCLVLPKLLGPGCTVSAGEKAGEVSVVTKFGTRFATKADDSSGFPDYKSIFTTARDAKGTTCTVNRKYLIELLSALPDREVDLKVAADHSPLFVKGEKATGLLGVIRKG